MQERTQDKRDSMTVLKGGLIFSTNRMLCRGRTQEKWDSVAVLDSARS